MKKIGESRFEKPRDPGILQNPVLSWFGIPENAGDEATSCEIDAMRVNQCQLKCQGIEGVRV